MPYTDRYNLNVDMSFYKETTIEVIKTIFTDNVFYIKADDYTQTWPVKYGDKSKPHSPSMRYGFLGIKTIIEYDGIQFDASTSVKEKEVYERKGIVYTSETECREETVYRCAAKYTVSCGAGFTSKISDTFWATRLGARMSQKRERVYLGETMSARLYFKIINGNPELVIKITDLTPLDKKDPIPATLKIGKQEVSYEFCRKIEERFEAEHVCIQPEEPGKDIEWKPPTDWISCTDTKAANYKAAFEVKYGVYMWIGSKKTEPDKKYLYIGIVGTDLNIKNTVGNRIFNQEMKEKGIAYENGIDQIDWFRYSELKNSGKFSAGQVLQTVEMQCINNFSSIFSYNNLSLQSSPETIIHPLFDGVFDKKKNYHLELLNQKKRYKNS